MNTKLFALWGNAQRLDGGAMFGNAPKALWQRWSPPDAENRIPLACRAMLLRTDDRVILCETGIGAYLAPEMRERYGVVDAEHMLIRALAELGLSHEDIDVVVLSHLHFDHVGGLLSAFEEGKESELLFPRATFVVGDEAFARALAPHARDRASFIPGLAERLLGTGRLEQVSGNQSDTLGTGFSFHRSHGHTPGLMLLEVALPSGPLVFAADLIPGRPWVHLPITMGYDRFPEALIDEKATLLADLIGRQGRLFFTHDPDCAVSRVRQDAKGRFSPYDDIAHAPSASGALTVEIPA